MDEKKFVDDFRHLATISMGRDCQAISSSFGVVTWIKQANHIGIKPLQNCVTGNHLLEANLCNTAYNLNTWSPFSLSRRVTQTTADLIPAMLVKAAKTSASISMLDTPCFTNFIMRSLSFVQARTTELFH